MWTVGMWPGIVLINNHVYSRNKSHTVIDGRLFPRNISWRHREITIYISSAMFIIWRYQWSALF